MRYSNGAVHNVAKHPVVKRKLGLWRIAQGRIRLLSIANSPDKRMSICLSTLGTYE